MDLVSVALLPVIKLLCQYISAYSKDDLLLYSRGSWVHSEIVKEGNSKAYNLTGATVFLLQSSNARRSLRTM